MTHQGRNGTGVSLFAAVALCMDGCSSAPPSYDVLITEPSGHVGAGEGQLFAHWSCDPSADPATRYQGAQDALWHDVDGQMGNGALRTQVACPTGALLTVQVDASAVSTDYSPTKLRCEVLDGDGAHVADESVTRGLGTSDPVCRVAVPRD